MQQPTLSVFTIAWKDPSDCAAVIADLRRQTARAQIELILVATASDGSADHAFEGFGGWQRLAMPAVTAYGAAAEAAVRAARAPCVTYAEEHSTFEPEWAAGLLAAHAQGHDVVGFSMDNANPGTLVSWAHLYGQFAHAVAPAASGERDMLGGHHISYRRDLLLGYGDALANMLEDEAALCLDQRSKGRRLYLAGDAVSHHVNLSRLRPYMALDFAGQRGFAATRARVGRWSRARRLAYVAAAPIIPFVRLRRIVRHIRRTGRAGELLPRILAPIACALVCGAVGEALGYAFGAGDSATRKAPAEFRRAEYLSADDPWRRSGRSEG